MTDTSVKTGSEGARVKGSLLWLLAIAVVAWFVTAPMRARMARETAALRMRNQPAQGQTTAQIALDTAKRDAFTHPLDPGLQMIYASALSKAGRFPEAIESLKAVERLEPGDSQPHDLMGQIYDALHQPDAAAAEFARALSLNPKDIAALTLLGYKYATFGWNRQAVALLTRALQQYPRDVRLHVALAMVYFQTDDHKDAEQQLLTARAVAPGDPSVLGPLIEVYRHAKRYPEALTTIEEELRAAPADRMPLVERAQVYLDMQRYRDAVDTASQVINSDPAQIRAVYIRGVAYKASGDSARAVADLERVKQAAGDLEATYLLLGQLYVQAGRSAGGAALLKQAAADKARGDAIRQLTYAVAAHPDDPVAHGELAHQYLQSANYARAIVEYRRALELKPDYAAARAGLRTALHSAGRTN